MIKVFFFSLLLVLSCNFISIEAHPYRKNPTMENSLMVEQALHEENKSFFFPRSMQLDVLRNHPQIIPILARWLYDEWHSYDPSLTVEKLIDSFQTRLNSDRVPITFVALKEGRPIGIVSLKRETDPTFSDFPADSVWMGGLQVIPEERNQGVGAELLKFAERIAKQLGYEKLYFYTSNPKNVPWYLERGAQKIEERPFHDHTITIMAVPLRDKGKDLTS